MWIQIDNLCVSVYSSKFQMHALVLPLLCTAEACTLGVSIVTATALLKGI